MSQGDPRGDPRGPKGNPKETKGDRRGPEGTPKGPRRPNVSKVCNRQQKQEGPNGTHGRPKGTQGRPKGIQGGKIGPGVSTKLHFTKNCFCCMIQIGPGALTKPTTTNGPPWPLMLWSRRNTQQSEKHHFCEVKVRGLRLLGVQQ